MPALPDDADPFEGEGADGGVFVFAFGALGVVVSAGPERVLNRLRGKLVKGLAKELGTEVALDASGGSVFRIMIGPAMLD